MAPLALVAAGIAAPLPAAAGKADGPPPTFPVRMVKLGGSPGSPAVRAHVDFSLAAGFNAFWVYGPFAGRWSAATAPDGPALDPAFVSFARDCRARGIRVFVSVNPMEESGGRFVFSEREGADRLRTFFDLLRREAGVRDFVLSFDDQPRELVAVPDVAEYGRSTAAAHLDLARRVLRRPGRGGSVWLCAGAYSDWQLDDDEFRDYSERWLAGLHRLPRRIGIVWTGPDTVSESITVDDLRATRRRLGGRTLLLYDNYPVNHDPRRQALGLVLGPLRKRDPRFAQEAAVYLACPMYQLGASRLALATVADFLRDPAGYDPDGSWKRAIARLAGADPVALDALRTQALEWGGWVDDLNYQGEDTLPEEFARQVDDPGIMASWNYTLRRYEERIAALAGVEDRLFRDDVVEAMTRRLAVARALPHVRTIRGAGDRSGEAAAEALRALAAERRRVASDPNVRAALDRFLQAVELLDELQRGEAAAGR